VSPDLAQCSPEGTWLEIVAARVRAHAWVADAHALRCRPDSLEPAGATRLVVPNTTGVRVLRSSGRMRLVAEWQELIRTEPSVVPVPLQWRLLESLPQPGSEAEARCTEPVRQPIVSDLARVADHALRCGICVPFDLAIFRGHFPAIPIVPAVVQIGWALDLARAHLEAAGRFMGIISAKFRRIVQPGMCLALALEYRPEIGQLSFEYSLRDAAVSIGRVRCGGADV